MLSKRREKHYTVDGIHWLRHDHTRCPGPAYQIDRDTHCQIRAYIESQVGEGDVCHRQIKLPYYTVPMWPAKKPTNVLLYSYCICSRCGSNLTGPAQITVLLCLGDMHGRLTMAWRVQLIGACCTHIDHQQLSYYAFVLEAQTRLLPMIEAAWDTFDDDNRANCRVCNRMLDSKTPLAPLCNDPSCLEMWPLFEQAGYQSNDDDATRTAERRMCNLVDHFFAEKTDLVMPLLGRVCHNPMCRRALQSTEGVCPKCHAAIFCSDQCCQQYHPSCSISYLDIWV